MKMNKTLLALAVITSAFTMNAMAVDQLESSQAVKSEGGNDITSPTISVSTDEISSNNVGSSFIAASGAWANSGTGPSLTNTGLLYTLNLPVVGSVPFGSQITVVNYSWNLSYIPSGLVVYLCWDTTSSCMDVSSSKTGSLTAFSGLDANKKFIYAFAVPGSGSVISPFAYGQTNQVIVNYN